MTLQIDHQSQAFPSVYAIRSGTLDTSWDELLWAALTVGRPSTYHVFRHGPASAHEAIFRLALDRANVLRFAAPKKLKTATVSERLPEPQALSAKRWSSWVRDSKNAEDKPLVQSSLNTMIELMGAFKRPFGHRLGKAIVAYVANYPLGDRGQVLHAPLADQVEMRLLPKLRGLEVHSFDEPFSKLHNFVARDLEDDALAQAIENSRQAAQDGSGQFVWNGVIR